MKRLIFFSALFVICSHAAYADDSGAYLGAGFNADGTLVACTNATATCNNHTTNSSNVNPALVAGYDFNKFVGTEISWANVGTYKVADSLGNYVGTVKSSVVTLAAKGGYKFDFGLSVFGKLGVGKVWNRYTPGTGWGLIMHNNQKSTSLAFALGVQYDFNNTIGVRIMREGVFFSDAGYDGIVGGTDFLAMFKF